MSRGTRSTSRSGICCRAKRRHAGGSPSVPSDELFVETEPLFATVDELRRSFRGIESPDGLVPVAFSNASASET